jgi:hypothetical protein
LAFKSEIKTTVKLQLNRCFLKIRSTTLKKIPLKKALETQKAQPIQLMLQTAI